MKSLVNHPLVERWLAQGVIEDQFYRWTWFMPALLEAVHGALDGAGLQGTLDEKRAGPAFFEWARAVEQSESYAGHDPMDHAYYICGRLLRCLLHAQAVQMKVPTTDDAVPESASGSALAREWPEGYVLLSFVCSLLEAYRQLRHGAPLDWQAQRFDQHWHSFRENVAEDADRAGPFLDFFLGLEPVWDYPTMPQRRPGTAARQGAHLATC